MYSKYLWGIRNLFAHFKPTVSGPYLAGVQGGQLPPLGKLNVDFF